jgi:hypothetical protein
MYTSTTAVFQIQNIILQNHEPQHHWIYHISQYHKHNYYKSWKIMLRQRKPICVAINSKSHRIVSSNKQNTIIRLLFNEFRLLRDDNHFLGKNSNYQPAY